MKSEGIMAQTFCHIQEKWKSLRKWIAKNEHDLIFGSAFLLFIILAVTITSLFVWSCRHYPPLAITMIVLMGCGFGVWVFGMIQDVETIRTEKQ